MPMQVPQPLHFSMSTMNCSYLPNPETPFAFLPPNIATELEVSQYINVASLGAFIWDLLSNVPSDYKLLFKHRLNLPTVVYFVSRIVAFAYIATSSIFLIGSVGNCQALQVAVGISFAMAVPSTSLLFFFRIRAIFNGKKLVVACFGFLWLAVLAGCVTVPFAISGVHIGPTTHCVNTGVKPFSSTGIVISAVNDTLVLIAISLRILYNASVDDNVGARVRMFWNGGALPRLSKSILQSGQQYYLITVGGNILTMVMILTPSVPPIYRAVFTVPSVTIENCMACKVYRDIKFGLVEQTSTSTFPRPTRAVSTNDGSTNVLNISRSIPESAVIPVSAVEIDQTSRDQLPIELALVEKTASRTSSTYGYATYTKT